MVLSDVFKNAVDQIERELADPDVRDLWQDYMPQIAMMRLLMHAMALGLDENFVGQSRAQLMERLFEQSCSTGEIYDAVKKVDPTWDANFGCH
jgi:hypothetical protein